MTYDQLVDDLVAKGYVDGPWRPVFEAVPRRHFIPEVALADHGPDLVPIDRRRDPEGWAAAVDADLIIVTQMDDGAVPADQPGNSATASSSMPMMVALMLRTCRIDDGMRVLEIGTGTGWNAALLAHRLGDQQVVTAEIDPHVAEQARKAMAEAGMHPQMVLGDGEEGWEPGAPYDRVLSTCTVHKIPVPWIEQTKPGGLIVTPWRDGFSHQGLLLRLAVAGGTATGEFVDWASFMRSRSQRFPVEEVPRVDGTESTTDLHPDQVLDGDNAEIAVGARVPDCQWWREEMPDGRFEIRLDDIASDSWAVVGPLDGDSHPTYPVRQGGPRRLWDEVEAAYRWWEQVGSPEFTRFGLTVTADRQWVWLDEPANEMPARRV